MPASRAGNFFNLIPVFGISIAYLFLGERLNPVQWAGAAIILVSVSVLQTWLTSSKARATSG